MSLALRDERGSLALLTTLLLPVLLVVLVGVLELGFVRVVAERARIAADLATLTAANDADEAHRVRTGTIRPAPDAEAVAREYFARNLDGVAAALAISTAAVAAAASVAVFRDPGGLDPITGRRYERPTVRLAAELPIRTPAFGLIGRPVTTVSLLSASSAR